LSQQEGIGEDQWCYRPKEGAFADGMTIAADYLKLSGYRPMPSTLVFCGASTRLWHGICATLIVFF
jgi:hypothetical protein